MSLVQDISVEEFSKSCDVTVEGINAAKLIVDPSNDFISGKTILASSLVRWLNSAGYDDNKALSVVTLLKDKLIELGDKLDVSDTWEGLLYLVVVEDSRLLTTEWDEFKCVSLEDFKPLEKKPIASIFYGLSLVMAYLRILARLRGLREGEEPTESDSSEPEA